MYIISHTLPFTQRAGFRYISRGRFCQNKSKSYIDQVVWTNIISCFYRSSGGGKALLSCQRDEIKIS